MSIYPYTTGSRKSDPTFGVASMAGEMEGGGWLFPNIDGRMAAPMAAFVGHLEAYVPTDHTPDEIMAAWFAIEGARRLRERQNKRRRGAALQARVLGG